MATETTKIPFIEGSAPATPAANRAVLYVKSDGLFYSKDDAGTETLVSGGAGGLTDHNHTTGGDGGDLDAPVIDGYAIWNEESAPSTPGAATVAVYAKSDGLMYSKDDAGTETLMSSGPGGGTITSATADQSADVTLSADTIADATSASISLAAGTWLVIGEMCISTTNGAVIYCLMAITDGSNTKVFESRTGVSSASPVSMSGHAVVTPGSTTTYKLRGQAAGGGTTKIIKNPEGGSEIGTRISAIKLA